MTITWAKTWPNRRDAGQDFVATDGGVWVGRIYRIDIPMEHGGFCAANDIEAALRSVRCALSGYETTREAAADRVKAAWSMWLKTEVLRS